jgi:hypothetical protein
LDRTTLAALLLSSYAVFAVVNGAEAPLWAYGAIAPIALALGATAHLTRHLDPDEPGGRALRRIARVGAASAALFAFGLVFFAWRAGYVATMLAVAVSGVTGLLAVSYAPAERSMVTALRRRRAHPLALLLVGGAPLGAIGLAVVAAPALGLSWERHADLVDSAAAAAGLAGVGLTTAVALLELTQRRAELGARERLRALAFIALTAFAAAVAVALLRLFPPTPTFLVAGVAVATFACHAATAPRADTLGRGALTVTTLAAIGVLPTVILAFFAKQRPAIAVIAVVFAAAAGALAALLAPLLRERLFPATEPWMEAFAIARRAASHSDPEVALARALGELGGLAQRGSRVGARDGVGLEAASLFRFDPPSVMTVDVAGYVRTESAEIPTELASLALEETESVLTIEALDAVAVRRPETRRSAAWMRDRGLRCVAIAHDGEAAVGLLALPLGDREEPLALSEVRAIAELTKLLGGHLATSAQLARSVGREAQLRADERELAKDLEETRRALARTSGRAAAFTKAIADRASVAAYSPAQRLALGAIDLAAERAAPLTLLEPPGVDPLPYAARYHLASPKRTGALTVVSGSDPALVDLELWRDEERSPLALDHDGTLVLLHPELFPKLVQAFIAAAAPSRVQLCAVLPATVDVLVAEDRLHETLGDVLGDRAVALPPLAARPEDLRALTNHVLTHIGLRDRRGPIGVDAGAMEWLVEHGWPGNEVELDTVLLRAALSMQPGSPVLTRADLLRSGFRPLPSSPAPGQGRDA